MWRGRLSLVWAWHGGTSTAVSGHGAPEVPRAAVAAAREGSIWSTECQSSVMDVLDPRAHGDGGALELFHREIHPAP